MTDKPQDMEFPEIKKKRSTHIVIHKTTFIVELRDVDTNEVIEQIGIGKNITDAVVIADKYTIGKKDTDSHPTMSMQVVD